MALTSITKDFVVKAGALIEGTSFVSSSTGQTGTLQVNGGAAIAKNLVVGTTATIWGNSTLVGSLTVNGYSTLGLLTATTFTATSANILGTLDVTGATNLKDILTVGGSSLFNGAVNTFSGALFVTGTNILTVGTGATTLGGTLTVDGKTLINNNTTAIVAGGGDGALKVVGGAYVGDNLIVASTASSTATNTGNALYVAGGAYVEKELTVSGPALFKDTVTFSGTATYVLSTNTFYTDNILEIHTPPSGVYGNWVLDDGKDIGFRFHYYGAGSDQNAALVLDNTSKELHWYSTGAESSGGNFSTAVYGTFRTGNLFLTNNTDASSTITGALQIAGGAGVGGTVYAGAANAGTVTARNLTTASGIVYSIGGQLQNTPVTFNATTQRLVGTIDYSNTSTNLAGGAAGSLPYQSGASATQMLPIGTNGQILVVLGGNPTWSAPTGLTAGSATTSSNIAGGVKDQIPYQSAPGQTTFNVGLAYNGTTFTTTNIVVSSGNNATAATGNSGALMVRGGVGIQNDLWVGGNINLAGNLFLDGVGLDTIQGTTGTFVNILVTGTNATNSAATGALIVTGGVGIGGGLFVNGVITGTTVNVTGVATVNNLSVTGFSSLSGGATASALTVTNALLVSGFSSLSGGATISAATVTNALLVSGFSSLSGGATISAATVTTTLNVTGYTQLNGGSTLNATTVTGSATVGTTLVVTGYTSLNGGATISAATVTNNLLVSGNETITGYTSMNGGATASALTVTNALTVGTTLGVTGRTTLGDAVISAATVTNNLLVSGNETVTGFTSLNGGATISAATVTNALTVGTTLGVTGRTTLGLLTATITTVTALTVIGNETVGGTLNVTGRTTLADAQITTVTATNLVVTGTASLPSNVNLSNLTVTNLTVTGNETVGGNLQVTGIFTASGISNHVGVATFSNVTDSNATNVGSIVTLGGVGIAKNLTVGTAVTVGSVSTQSVVTALFSNNSLYSSYTSQFIVTNALINLDTFSSSAYRTAKYIIQIVDGVKVQVEEIMLFHDGTNVYMTEYASMNNTGNLGDFDAVLNAGTVTLNFTANYSPTSMTVKVVRTAITL